MSKTRRPPEILRKSHPHLDRDERAKSKRELLDALDDAVYDDDQDEGADGSDNKDNSRRTGTAVDADREDDG